MSEVRRRPLLIFTMASVAVPTNLLAQQSATIPRVGFLSAVPLSGMAIQIEALRAGVRDLGYVEGKNISFEFRSAEGKYERLPELAAELVRLKVDLIVSGGSAKPI